MRKTKRETSMPFMGQRHINRGVVSRERQPKIIQPKELDLAKYGSVLVGRYVDMSAKIEHVVHDPLTQRSRTVTSWGSFMDFMASVNGYKEKYGFSVIDEPQFVMYADITDALNRAATQNTSSPRRAEQERRKYLLRSKTSFQNVAHENQRIIDETDAQKALVLQELVSFVRETGTEINEKDLSLQKMISFTGPIWSNGYSLPVKTQPTMLEYAHPNGSNLTIYPAVKTVDLLRQEESITYAFNSEGLKLGNLASRAERVGVPVISSYVALNNLPEQERPFMLKPPSQVPVNELEIVSFDIKT